MKDLKKDESGVLYSKGMCHNDEIPNITFRLMKLGMEYVEMPLEAKFFTRETKTRCEYLIENSQHFFILGRPFTQKYYTILDA